jgi:hypothetical protein
MLDRFQSAALRYQTLKDTLRASRPAYDMAGDERSGAAVDYALASLD